jgi:hypothetical protein
MPARSEPPDARLNASRYLVDRLDAQDPETEEASAASPGAPNREQRAAIVETAIQQAMRRGEFDNLPGAGKPLPALGGVHDPDWWIRRKIEREQLTGLGPPALTLRTESAGLDDSLDALHRESEVREVLEDFNHRVVEARRQLLGGPPVVTPTRDVEAEVARWRERRSARERALVARQAEEAARRAAMTPRERRRHDRRLRRQG